MALRALPLAFLFALGLAGAVSAAEPLTGTYRVTGQTVDKATGIAREISGTISVKQEGARYRSRFELRTVLPGSHAAPAQVLGTGEGTVEGQKLRGTADTQLLTSAAGVDVGFVGMPRTISARIRSTSVATVEPDGSITVEIDNEPAEGDAYAPTRTRLQGSRVPDKPDKPAKTTPR
jgi:hypothetical protein